MLEAFGLLRFAIRPWKFQTSCLEGPQNRHENFQRQMPSGIFSIYHGISYATQNDQGDFQCHYIKTEQAMEISSSMFRNTQNIPGNYRSRFRIHLFTNTKRFLVKELPFLTLLNNV